MINGKQLLLYEGYTFYKQRDRKNHDRWYCTSQPKCKAFILTDKNINIHDSFTVHNHMKKQLVEKNGLYLRI